MPTVRTQGAGGAQQAGAGASGGAGGGSGAGGGAPAQRTTFRPPWIKEGPEPLPMPAAPWTLARARDRRTSRDEPAEPPAATPARKQSKITIVPSQPSTQENGVDPDGLKKDVVSAATAKKQQQQKAPESATAKPNNAPQERKINIQVESKQRSEPKAESKAEPKVEAKAKAEPKPPPKPEPKEAKKPPAPREPRRPPEPQPVPLARSRSNRSATNLAPLPPPMPAPPPPPPPPDFKKEPLTKKQEEKLQKLRNGRARKRPDWSAMMKEVEQGLRLRHVQCNDRSQPLLPEAKVKGQFMYDSEKPNVHNQLLREIQSGVKLKKVKTNDRSRPVLQGLRKFRRQLTIEEQQQQAQEEPDAAEPDELDDIDTLRDDLQSTKQMLALELRNKEAVEKENKRLQARILNLEVELDEERKRKAAGPAEEAGSAKKSLEAEKVAEQLREQLSEANKHTHDLEQRVHEADLQAELLRAELEELRRRNTTLERRVSNVGKDQPLSKQPSAKKLNKSMSAVNAAANASAGAGVAPAPEEEEEEDEEEEEETETETESEEEGSSEDEEKAAALREKRQAREMKLLSTKVRSLKEKQDTVRKERRALRLALRNQTKALKEESRKHRKLQKEVDKMAKLLKDDDEEEEEEEEEEGDDEEEEEEESEEESSTEESEEEESEGELPADAPFEDRKKNFTERAKRHENILAALKKGNYLLKANVEKVKDDLFKQKELSLTMQEDLNSVLAELG